MLLFLLNNFIKYFTVNITIVIFLIFWYLNIYYIKMIKICIKYLILYYL